MSFKAILILKIQEFFKLFQLVYLKQKFLLKQILLY